MGAIAAGDLTYTIVKQKKLEDGRKIVQATIAFGNSTLTYPAGGVPLSVGKLGFGVLMDSLTIEDSGSSAYAFNWDKANQKIMMFGQTPASHTHSVPAHAHDLLVKGGQAGSTTNDVATYATNILGKEAATDVTIAGVDSATKGGVIQLAAGTSGAATPASIANAELSGTAIAAQTLKVTCIGY